MAQKTTSNPGTPTKTKNEGVDEKKLSQIKEHAKQLKSTDSQRDDMFKKIDEMYLMTWAGDSGNKYKKAKIIVSPDARNTALGAVRLMVATDPIFNIVNSKETQEVTSKIEKAVNKLWDAAGRAAGNPVHYDAVLSSILYSEMHSGITSTASLVQAAKENGEGQARAEAMATKTPFLIEDWHPISGHSEFDKLGLTAYYRETETTGAQLKRDFGKNVPKAISDADPYKKIVLNSYWDTEYGAHWTESGDLICAPHGLPFIPVVVQYTEGSRLWTKPEEARQPLLYTLLKSGLWTMQNLIYTVMYTLTKEMGVTPLYVHTNGGTSPGKKVNIDYDENPAVVELEAGETFQALQNKGLIDPAVREALQIATQKGQESTLYAQALGAPVQGDSTFSELALLSQSGRLPLVGTQKRGGWGISAIVEMCLAMMKADGTDIDAAGIDLKASEIPGYVQIETKLDIKLPQDKLQQANIANLLRTGDQPLMDDEWIRSNVLNVNQSDDVDRKIWTEKATFAMFVKFMQEQMQPQQPPMVTAPNQPQPNQQGQITTGPQMPENQGERIQGMPPQQGGMVLGPGQAEGGQV